MPKDDWLRAKRASIARKAELGGWLEKQREEERLVEEFLAEHADQPIKPSSPSKKKSRRRRRK